MTVIATLITSLGLESSKFTSGLNEAQKALRKTQKQFAAVGANMTKVGAVLSAGITLPFVALVKAAIPAAVEANQAAAQVNAALASMGPVAGRTAAQLGELAGRLQDTSNFDDDDIMKQVTANLLTFGNVHKAVFDRAEQSIIDISARMGTDLQSSALMVGKALNDPVKGIKALTRAGIQFTDAQKAQIAAMVKVGDTAGAQGIMLGELERQFGGAARAQRDATPDAAMQQQWRTFQEVIGNIALKVLPPLTSGLASVLKAFNDLSPATQKMVVVGTGIAAIVGPSLVALGGVVSAVGKLLPVFTSIIGLFGTGEAAVAGVGVAGEVAAGGLGIALAPLLPIIAAIAGAVALAYAAWQHWDTIGPMLSGLWSTITDTVGPPLTALFGGLKQVMMDLWNGPFGQFLTEAGQRLAWLYSIGEPIVAKLVKAFWDFSVALSQALGPTVKGVLSGIGQFIMTVFRGIGDVINIVASLLRGDFSGAWHYAGKLVTDVAGGVRGAAQTMAAGVLDSVSRLVAGVRDWIGQKLTAAMNLALAPIRGVAAAFKWLDDVVVRHSYIPDMVDSIGDHMRRLDAEMVQPAKGATSAAEQAFRDLAQRVQPLLARLFPEQARFNELKQQLADLDAFAKKKKWSGAELEEAQQRARRVSAGQDPDGDDGTRRTAIVEGDPIRDATEAMNTAVIKSWGFIEVANDNLKASFQDTVDTVAGAVRGLADSIKSHDWLGALQGVLDVITKLGASGVFGKTFKARIDGLSGARAMGGPVLARRSYLVGEDGPEILRMGGAGGSIIPNDQIGNDNPRGGGGSRSVQIVPSPYFDVVVDGRVQRGVGGNNRAMAMRGRQRL